MPTWAWLIVALEIVAAAGGFILWLRPWLWPLWRSAVWPWSWGLWRWKWWPWWWGIWAAGFWPWAWPLWGWALWPWMWPAWWWCFKLPLAAYVIATTLVFGLCEWVWVRIAIVLLLVVIVLIGAGVGFLLGWWQLGFWPWWWAIWRRSWWPWYWGLWQARPWPWRWHLWRLPWWRWHFWPWRRAWWPAGWGIWAWAICPGNWQQCAGGGCWPCLWPLWRRVLWYLLVLITLVTWVIVLICWRPHDRTETGAGTTRAGPSVSRDPRPESTLTPTPRPAPSATPLPTQAPPTIAPTPVPTSPPPPTSPPVAAPTNTPLPPPTQPPPPTQVPPTQQPPTPLPSTPTPVDETSTFGDPLNDVILIDDAGQPVPGQVNIAGHGADIGLVDVRRSATETEACVNRPSHPGMGNSTGVTYRAGNVSALYQLHESVLTIFVQTAGGAPVAGGVVRAEGDGRRVCFLVPVPALGGATTFQIQSFHRPLAGQNRGFDQTASIPFSSVLVLEDEEGLD